MIHDKEAKPEGEGCYVYCVTGFAVKEVFNKFGVEEEVYTIPYKGISAVVSHCLPKPYHSDDPELVKRWLIQHEQVVDYFAERYNAVIPLAFNTIVIGRDREVRVWLRDEYLILKRKIERVRGKQEFGVQLFCDSKAMAMEVNAESAKIQRMLEEGERVITKPYGSIYHSGNSYPAWRYGSFYITDKRVLLVRREPFEVLAEIYHEEIEKVFTKAGLRADSGVSHLCLRLKTGESIQLRLVDSSLVKTIEENIASQRISSPESVGSGG